ncbi:cold-regulated 413 plasma membrane protein 2-like [Tasmannia lanceolata]|uniref:cold-regulated 413 plasma membrane protein 2-like n=1 Tax=Tasmannia lanceolata TaxID=3420 RepID=UPI004062D7C6
MENHPSTPTFSERGLNYFHWGGTFAAIFLLILNHVRRKSHMQTSLLVSYIFLSLPPALFKVLRGQFGSWVSFLAVVFNLFYPQSFPASRFPLFVVTPSLVAHELRSGVIVCILGTIIGVFILIEHIRGTGGCGNCWLDLHYFSYFVGISFLLFFPILDLSMGA